MLTKRTNILFEQELWDKLVKIARARNISTSSVIREALQEGLTATQFQSNASALGLIKIGQLAEKLKAKGPKDLSENLDKYTWDE